MQSTLLSMCARAPILPIPLISDFFPRFHDYPCTPPPPREKKILKEETFNGETGGGYKDGERRGDNDGDREEVFDSDDDDNTVFVLEVWLVLMSGFTMMGSETDGQAAAHSPSLPLPHVQAADAKCRQNLKNTGQNGIETSGMKWHQAAADMTTKTL
ncbi:double C2-like domain-containing protein beta isoform X1, partial [Lates japonicus]